MPRYCRSLPPRDIDTSFSSWALGLNSENLMRNHSFLLRWLPLVYGSFILSSLWWYMLSRFCWLHANFVPRDPIMLYWPYPQLPVGNFTCLYGGYDLLVFVIQVLTIQASVTLVTSWFLRILTIPSLCIPLLLAFLAFKGSLPFNFLLVLVTFEFGPPAEHNPVVIYLGLLVFDILTRAFTHPSASLFQFHSLWPYFSLMAILVESTPFTGVLAKCTPKSMSSCLIQS